MKDLGVIVLAAGKSTRMKSKKSKVLHPLAGLPLVSYPLKEVSQFRPSKVVLVVGKGQQESFSNHLGKKLSGVEFCVQSDALGTGDAVLRAQKIFKGFKGYILIQPGDVPLVRHESIRYLIDEVKSSGAECGVASTIVPYPFGYGRILRNSDGKFIAIREEKDAAINERKISEINTGIFLAKSEWLFKRLRKVKPHNAQKEYYLTDVIEMAVREGDEVVVCCLEPFEQFLGVNDRCDLADAGKVIQINIAERWMAEGVTIIDPMQAYIDATVKIGNDTTIAPGVFLRGETKIGKNCFIDTGSVIEDSTIDNNVHVKPHTVIEGGHIKDGVVVGPFSRVRPGSILDKDVRVGNFVEVKKSHLHQGVKANHLSYIGDATIGSMTNVGCGTITCNYDGKKKHKTVIGEGVFVGSDTQFVAPVKIGKGAVIGAGSTVTKNVPAGALALSRTEQKNIVGWVKKKRTKL